MSKVKALFLSLALFCFAAPSFGQVTNPGLQQAGSVTRDGTHCAIWGPGVGQLQDAGTCAGFSPVQSVFGRTGAVVAATNDYLFNQIGGALGCSQLPSFTGDVTNSGCALTLANTITAAGPVGSATVTPIITFDAKGRLTLVSSATITPAFSSLTGQLAAGQIPNSIITNAMRANMAANTVSGNFTGSAAAPSDNALPSCPDTGANRLNYVSGTGFVCGTGGTVAGAWYAGGVTAQNNATTPNTIMDITADILTFWNPATGTISTSRNVTLTSDISCSGPAVNCRDQAAAYVAADDVWTYGIHGTSGTGTINSKSPPTVGPTLPSGYTEYVPLFVNKIWTGPTILAPLPQGGSSQIAVRGNSVSYLNAPDLVIPGYPTCPASLTAWLPAGTKLSNLEFDNELTSVTALIAGATVNTPLGNTINQSLYVNNSAGGVTAMDTVAMLALPSNRNISSTFLVSSGTLSTSSCDIFVLGYTF